MLTPWEKSYPQRRQHIKSRAITLPTKVSLVKAMVFPVVMNGCESWTIKKAEHWRIDAFELWYWRRLLRVPWTARRSNQSVHSEGDQSWDVFRRNDAEAETPVLWPPDVTSWLIWKDPNAGNDWRQEEKGTEKRTAEDEMVGGDREADSRGWDGWMASLIQWTWVWVNCRSGDGQGDLACCSPWRRKQSDTTEGLNWTELWSCSRLLETDYYLFNYDNVKIN